MDLYKDQPNVANADDSSASQGLRQQPVRKRNRPVEADGMTSMDGVRLVDGQNRTHLERMARHFDANTANAI